MPGPWEKYSAAWAYESLFAEEVDMRDLGNAMPDQWETGQLLPIKKNRRTGEYDWAVPQLLSALIDGIMAPGRALQGEYRYIDLDTGRLMRLDESGRYISIDDDAANAAMAVSPGALIGTTAKTAARALTRASRSAGLYDPPAKAPRPFEADYPNAEGVANEAGQLVKDIEGRPLGAEFIVGRRELGGADEPLLAPGVLAEEYGIPVERVPARRIGGDAGRLVMGRVPETAASSARIAVDRSLSAAASDRVIAHEVGHLIDELAGRIGTSGLNIELRQIYNTLNTGEERARHLTGPQHRGYRGEDISLELMAVAIRAYLADPNYIKTVAPKTAARIRAAVNEHPRLRDHIQFNVQGALPPTDDDESGPWQKYSAASSDPLPDPLDELAPLMPLLRTMPR